MDDKVKKSGQVYTPRRIVDEMLDYAGYGGPAIIGRHVMDNSCGDGAFLRQVVRRYCEAAGKEGLGKSVLKRHLETYIHGIDTDADACRSCLAHLDEAAGEYGAGRVSWDLHNRNALSTDKFNGKMDFVVGNPPYVRVHNLDTSYEDVKRYKFANGGMTDLYLAFFELGFNMLGPAGKLCYITPSSWLNSVAAGNMRAHIARERSLVSLVDLGHYQPFERATAYTVISLFAKDRDDPSFDYYVFNGDKCSREFRCRLSLDDCLIDSCLYLSDKESLRELREIKSGKYPRYVTVKNGFATLADDVFIGESIPPSAMTIKVLKASTGKWHPCLFPYDKRGKLLAPETVFSDPAVALHLKAHKEKLLKGRSDYATYYEYGRTQALADVWREKTAINTLIRTEKDLKIERVKEGEGVYSGLYVVNDLGITTDEIKDILIRPDFARYVSLLKKYKSGGYYTFNTKDVQQYVNFRLSKRNVRQPSFGGQDFRIV